MTAPFFGETNRNTASTDSAVDVARAHLTGQEAWIEFAPCGCVCGVLSTDVCGTTVHRAWKEFHPNRDRREEAQRDGFELHLGSKQQARELLQRPCPHDPQWGVQPPPCPTGMHWALPYLARSSAKQHLVPAAGIRGREMAPVKGAVDEHGNPNSWWTRLKTVPLDEQAQYQNVVALCGRAFDDWCSDGYDTYEHFECSRCTTIAHDMATQQRLTELIREDKKRRNSA